MSPETPGNIAEGVLVAIHTDDLSKVNECLRSQVKKIYYI
jgi:hypothetical protein